MSAEVIPLAANLRRSTLVDVIQNATMIPYIEETLFIMTLGISRPSAGVFYPWNRLLLIKNLPDEFHHSVVSGELPRSVGPDKLDAVEIVRNERDYIHDLLFRAGQVGYKTAWVLSEGIIFYLRPEHLPENARAYSEQYCMNREQIEFIRQYHGFDQVVTMIYPVVYSPKDIQFMGYELAIHYQTLNMACNIYTDPSTSTTLLQIFPKNYKIQ